MHDVYNEEWDSEGSGEEEEEEGEGGEEEGPLTNMGEGERARVSWEVRYTDTPVTFAKIFLHQI